MTKLTQTLNKELDSNFELNDIMNPTLSFLRKLLLTFISRLGAAEGDRSKINMQESQESSSLKYQKNTMKKWIQTEFICPELDTDEKKIKYQPYRLKLEINKHLFKRDICSEIQNVQGNAGCILQSIISKQEFEKKKR